MLEISLKPFKETTDATRQIVTQMNIDLKCNYGFAGPMFAEYVVNHESQWLEWKKMFRDEELKLAQGVKDPIAARLAEYMALIKVTGIIMHEAIPGLWTYKDDFNGVWANIIDNASDATSEKAAMRLILSWAQSNAEAFEGREQKIKDGNKRIPPGGWAGKWDSKDNWEYIGILSGVLDKVLSEAGFNPEEVKLQWRELGWIDVEGKSSRGYTKQVRLFGQPSWMVCIKRIAFEKAYEDDSITGSDLF